MDKIIITEIHEEDLFTCMKADIIGKTFLVEELHKSKVKGYYAGSVYKNKNGVEYHFYAMKYQPVSGSNT